MAWFSLDEPGVASSCPAPGPHPDVASSDTSDQEGQTPHQEGETSWVSLEVSWGEAP